MKKILNLFYIVFIFTITSCEEFDSNAKSSNTNSVAIKDGRLYFPTKSIFKEYMGKYIDASEKELSNFFDPLYKRGFYSLRPIVTEENERMIYNNYIKLKPNSPLKTSAKTEEEDYFDYLDEIEDIIGDDVFAAFLNEKGEIQIEDIVYKYTDVGLFFAKEDKLDNLKQFLELRNISEDLKIKTPDQAKSAIINDYPNSGSTNIDGDLTYFRLMYNGTDFGNTGSTTGSYNPAPNSPVSSDPSFYAYFNNLQYCDQIGGFWSWVSNLFGDNNVCIDRYESRRRVKTKSFNYNYLIVYHMGVKVHHQYRGWTGLWRTEAIDEIRMFVEAGQFEYNADKLLNNAVINNASQEKAYYLNNQKILFQPNTMTLNNVTFTNLDHSSLPQVFQNDGLGLTFECFSTGWNWLDDQIENGIDSSLKASKLNEYFYNALYTNTKSKLQTILNNFNYSPPSNRTFVAKFPENGKYIVQKSVLEIAYGNGIAQKTFDWGVEVRIGGNQNGDDSWSISVSQGNQLIRPENFRVKMIGAVRSDSWHGSKMSVGID